jgi:hypothetical protein
MTVGLDVLWLVARTSCDARVLAMRDEGVSSIEISVSASKATFTICASQAGYDAKLLQKDATWAYRGGPLLSAHDRRSLVCSGSDRRSIGSSTSCVRV